ncbi:MAG: SDR family NAD(P)-dependent oxidoreductase [Thermoplasmata archaeon]|nr:SDR family NAD(P)-dependent oxidoreductase [Thermoplasmata archaeon]
MTRVSLVTGASRGIGRATALRLANDGHDVVVNYVEQEEAARSVADQVEALGRRSLAFRADVGSPDEVRRMVEAASEDLGPVTILVNNAGIYRRVTVDELVPERWERTLAVNLTGAFHAIRAVLPGMRKAGWGRIVNVSSQVGLRGTDHGADYAASKAGLLGLTKAIALEAADDGITVNAVAPGTIETDIIKDYTREDREARHRAIPLGRIGLPEEVASMISYLTSEEARYITGATFHVNGGYLIV